MKFYISVDIEGISGVIAGKQTSEGGFGYERAQKLMTEEVNAVIRGLKSAGAAEIIVNDSHGPMTNILIEHLDEAASLISGNKKLLGMMEGIDESFDAALLIGYHSRHNEPGVLSHTYHSGVVSEVRVNGMPVGEFEFNSMLAGYFGVPVVMVSGDDKLSWQVKQFNENIESIVVKHAHSRYTAECIPPKKVHKLLEEGAAKILSSDFRKNILPFKVENEGRVVLELTFLNSGLAEATLAIPGVELTAPNKVEYVAKDMLEAFKLCRGLIGLASTVL
jgi:D-amino peptidase